MKIYQLPEGLPSWIARHLAGQGVDIEQSQKLAKAILGVSSQFQETTSVTPWSRKEHWAAYLAYFLPLNAIRALKVIDEAKSWSFFDGVSEVVDFGCGPGTTSKVLVRDKDIAINKILGVDQVEELAPLFLDEELRSSELQFSTRVPSRVKQGSLLTASYVLNELSNIPTWFFDYDRLLVLEPSTRQAFPRLLKLRQKLIEKGYHVIAPCPHTQTCPLSQSKKDWCHDRVRWQQPQWFEKIENHLPMKNRTLSFSYLLASRTALEKKDYVRVVSDPLVEKGKTRWLICRDEEKKYISFLKRHGKPPEIDRGDRLKIGGFEDKGSELRFTPGCTLNSVD